MRAGCGSGALSVRARHTPPTRVPNQGAWWWLCILSRPMPAWPAPCCVKPPPRASPPASAHRTCTGPCAICHLTRAALYGSRRTCMREGGHGSPLRFPAHPRQVAVIEGHSRAFVGWLAGTGQGSRHALASNELSSFAHRRAGVTKPRLQLPVQPLAYGLGRLSCVP